MTVTDLNPYRVVKAHIRERRYCAIVIDIRRDGEKRKVYRASRDGWTLATRKECHEWILAHQL